MKRRSHRLPISDPPDDWGDGSWTVDCVCGVNFDDGEEMVNCDECGVWVHTRCSRFVKGETSFACDKCKKKKNRNDSEETEVAQLLVELPTKTVMNATYPSSAPSRPSFRLWTDIPMEERVHVQGIPGGDPALFRGLSSVFTPELWKCTGYVPKKLNVQYKEFSCWEENLEADAKIEDENENLVDKGAGVLFSLSKEIVSATPVETSIELRGPFDGTRGERNPSAKEMRKREDKDYRIGRMHNGMKRERNQLRPVGVHSGKRKKEDSGAFKDRSGMKKARNLDKEADNKKRDSGHAYGALKLEFSEDGDVKSKTDSLNIKNEDIIETVLPVPDLDGCLEETTNANKNMGVSAAKPHSTEGIFNDNSREAFLGKRESSSDILDNQAPLRNENYPVTGGAPPLLELNDAGCIEGEREDVKTAVDGRNPPNDGNYEPRDLSGGSSSVAVDSQNPRPLTSKLSSTTKEVQEYQMLQDSNGCSPSISIQSNIKLKIGEGDEHPMKDSDVPSLPISDVKSDMTKFSTMCQGRSALAQVSEKHQVHDTTLGCLPSSDQKAQDNERKSKAVSHCDWENIDEGMVSVSDEPRRCEQELEGSISPVKVQEGSLELKCALKHAEEPVKLGESQPSPPSLHTQRKVVAGVAKSSSTSSTVVTSKLSVPGSCKPVVAPTPPRPFSSTRRVKMNSYADGRRGHAVSDIVKDGLRHEVARKTAKENSKDSVLKTQQTSKISQASLSKCAPTDSKEQMSNASSRSSVAQSVAASSCFVESAGLQTQGASNVQSKITASGFSKSEKFSQSNSQPSSKLNNSPLMHPPAPVNSSTALSDEELALLLHQELNSSPRVPRVPRVRHAGSMPPLASPAAISLLIKRSSSSGSKEQVSRRKNKEEASKDDCRSSREPGDDSKKIDGLTSLVDQRRREPVPTDASTKRETSDRSLELVHSGKKNMPSAATVANSGPSSSTETIDQNLSSIRNSPREIADDDIGTLSGHAPRTLSGLIDEILSKGKSMTYEELCNAVLPHWQNLRKHNGERYASSHSQAVLDCLRNRNEWPQLIDRGTKTNGNRKRQKLDAEPSMLEFEDNELVRGRYRQELEGKTVESQQEDFPKGKRKARKRRRLALQGRGINDVRKRQKVAVTDDDFDPFSYSSEGTEGIFSEDESQGVRVCPVGSEASTGSDERGLL